MFPISPTPAESLVTVRLAHRWWEATVFMRFSFLQLSIASLFIIVVLAVVTGVILYTRIDQSIDLLNQHGAAIMAGIPINETDPFSIDSLTKEFQELKWTTIDLLVASFTILTAALGLIFWRGLSSTGRQAELIRLQRQALRSQKSAETLIVVINKINSTLDYEAVLQIICQECRTLMGASGVDLWMLEGDEVVKMASWFPEQNDPYVADSRQPLEEDSPMLPVRVIRSEKAEIFSFSSGSAIPTGTRAEMSLPIMKDGKCLGAINLIYSDNTHRFGDEDLEVASTFALHTATALENARSFQDISLELDRRTHAQQEGAEHAKFLEAALQHFQTTQRQLIRFKENRG